jgi:regulator of protease activity HflC (stomatin/prohibitin superfamily)
MWRPQICITKDNIAVEVDGVLYLQVIDPQKASYGIDNYKVCRYSNIPDYHEECYRENGT